MGWVVGGVDNFAREFEDLLFGCVALSKCRLFSEAPVRSPVSEGSERARDREREREQGM